MTAAKLGGMWMGRMTGKKDRLGNTWRTYWPGSDYIEGRVSMFQGLASWMLVTRSGRPIAEGRTTSTESAQAACDSAAAAHLKEKGE